MLSTQAGKAEILLTPGVFFRVGENSTATMISPSLTNTEVGLDKGTALVEVAELHEANLLEVREGDSATQLLKTGLYAFDADQGAVRVLKGEALVQAPILCSRTGLVWSGMVLGSVVLVVHLDSGCRNVLQPVWLGILLPRFGVEGSGLLPGLLPWLRPISRQCSTGGAWRICPTCDWNPTSHGWR